MCIFVVEFVNIKFVCSFVCLFVSLYSSISKKNAHTHQLVVLLVAATVSAQYYNYQGEPYQPPFVHAQPTVHYQPFNHFQPVNPDGQWQILRDNRHQSPSGEYAYEYETQNGIIANEQSYIASPNQAQRKTGFFQYPSPDGRTIRVDYVADENGFQVSWFTWKYI